MDSHFIEQGMNDKSICQSCIWEQSQESDHSHEPFQWLLPFSSAVADKVLQNNQ
jgi:hypothetical protein